MVRHGAGSLRYRGAASAGRPVPQAGQHGHPGAVRRRVRHRSLMSAVTGLRALTLDQLAASFATADDALIEALGAECKRRDRLDRGKRARQADPVTAEWRDSAHAQFVAAEAATRGFMLNRRGRAAAIEPWSLWSGPATRAMAYASYELAEFWSANARLTVSEYRRQIAAGHRIEEDEHERE